MAAVYQRHDFLVERAAALEAWARHVLAAAEGRASAADGASLVELRPRLG